MFIHVLRFENSWSTSATCKASKARSRFLLGTGHWAGPVTARPGPGRAGRDQELLLALVFCFMLFGRQTLRTLSCTRSSPRNLAL